RHTRWPRDRSSVVCSSDLGLSGASWDSVLLVVLYVPIPLAVLLAASRPLDLLALGEESAGYLGADVEAVKRRVYLAASLLTAVSSEVRRVGNGVSARYSDT